MTEDEATNKWCPMVRLEGNDVDELGANRTRSGRIPDAACCIASDCMMWIDERQSGRTIWLGGCGLKVRS